MTIAVAQEGRNSVTGSAASETLGSAVAAGSSIHVFCSTNGGTAPTFAVTDNHGSTYTARGPVLADVSASHFWQQFTADNVSAGSLTVTNTVTNGGPNSVVIVREISGTSGFDTNAQSTTSPGASGTDAATSGSATPSVQPGLISAICTESLGSYALSAGTGFTLGTSFFTTQITEQLRYTSTAAAAATFSATGSTGSFTYFALAAFFKETAVAPPPPLVGQSGFMSPW